MVWKPSPTTPLCGIAIQKVLQTVFEKNNLPPALCTLVCGDADVGIAMSKDQNLPLVSFTGSTQVGLKVATEVQNRFGNLCWSSEATTPSWSRKTPTSTWSYLRSSLDQSERLDNGT